MEVNSTFTARAPLATKTVKRRLGRRVAFVGLSLFGALLAGFVLWPAPIDPVAWTPAPAMPMTGVLAPNDELRKGELIGQGRLFNPEDVVFDAEGRMYVGSRDFQPGVPPGNGDSNPHIVRVMFDAQGQPSFEEFVKLPGGGPLDLRFDRAGNLIVASWGQGVVSISPQREVKVLVPEGAMIDGKKFVKPDGLAIAADGRIFFTQGTSEPYDAVLQILAARAYGRLIEYNPATGSLRTLIPELTFANGIALAPDESYLLVADMFRYRIKRYWLKGPQAGKEDIFTDSLPGMPHNIFLDDRNVLWVALYQSRPGIVAATAAFPFVKKQLSKLPSALLNPPQPVVRDEKQRGKGLVLALDLNARPLLSLQNPPMSLDTISTAVYHGGFVYVGTITGGPVLRYQLAQRP